MADENLRTTLADNDAILVERTQSKGHTGTGFPVWQVLVREWRQVSAAVADTLVVNATLTVTNPVIDRQTYTGVYLLDTVRVQTDDQRQATIRQTMVLPNSKVSSSIPTEADAELHDRKGEITVTGATYKAKDVLTRKWRFFHPDLAKAAIEAMEARATVATPSADGVAATGTYLVADVWAEDGPNRTVTIYERLALPNGGLDTDVPKDDDAELHSRRRIQSHTGATYVGPDIIIRKWPFFDPDGADAAVTAMGADKTVTNPEIDGQEITGVFLISRAWAEDGPLRTQTIFQELILPNNVTDGQRPAEADAALDSRHSRKVAEDEGASFFGREILVRKWEYIDPDDSKNIIDAMKSTETIARPYVDGEQLVDPTPAIYRQVDVWAADGPMRTVTIFEMLVLWNAWGHDSYAHDSQDYHNAGTSNEKEVIVKRWMGIDVGDLATAISNCRTGTNVPAEAGYIITKATVINNGNGSITLVQQQIKQVNNVDVASAAIINPLGPYPAIIDITDTIYDDFTTSGLATAVTGEAEPSGYKRGAQWYTTRLKPNGLYIRTYQYYKLTGSNPVPIGVQTAIFGKETQAEVYKRDRKTYYGTDLALAPTHVGQLSESSDPNYKVTSVDFRETGNGLADINQHRAAVNDDDSSSGAIVLGADQNIKGVAYTLTRMWPSLDWEVADALIGTHDAPGTARSNFTLDGETYFHWRHRRDIDERSGLVRVTQFGRKRGAFGFIPSRYTPDLDEDNMVQRYVRTIAGNYNVTISKKLVDTAADAATYANGSTSYANMPAGRFKKRPGGWDYVPNEDKYLAFKETWTVAAGTHDFGAI